MCSFSYDAYTYTKRRVESNEFEVCKNFRPPHITKNNQERNLKFLTLEGFRRRSWSGFSNKNNETHGFISKHIDRLFPSDYFFKRLTNDLFCRLHSLSVSQLRWNYIWKHIYRGRIHRKWCSSSWIVELSYLL